MDQDDAEVEQVFNRVHGEPRPRPRVAVLVVQVVNRLVPSIAMPFSIDEKGRRKKEEGGS